MSTIPGVPDAVPEGSRNAYRAFNDIRAGLKKIGEDLWTIRQVVIDRHAGNSEVIANATISYRSIEDASMRLGKCLQHLDGGASVYDPKTVAGPTPNAQADRIEALETALGFAASVIKSGEPWTGKCEEVIGGALHRPTEQVINRGPDGSPVSG